MRGPLSTFAPSLEQRSTISILLSVATFFCVLVYIKGQSLLWPAGLIFLSFLGCSLLFSFRRTAQFFFLYLALFPAANWGERYPFFHGLYYRPVFSLAFIALLFFWHGFESPSKLSSSRFPRQASKPMLLWILVLFYALLFGLFYQSVFNIIQIEFLHLALYFTYFLWVRRPIEELRRLWTALAVITLVTSIQFIMLAISEGGFASVILGRIVTQQSHLAQLIIPFLFSYLLFQSKPGEKIIALLFSIPILAMAFLSQQRGLWGGLFISISIVFTLYYFQNGFSGKRFFRFIVLYIGSLLLALIILLIFDHFFTGSLLLTFISRMDFLANLSIDESWSIRMSEINRALSIWDNRWYTVLLGSGLGAHYPTIDWTRSYPYLVDNSFAYILWKLGLVGLFAYLSIWSSFIKQGLTLIRSSIPTPDKRLVSGLLAGFIGLALIGLTNGCLVQYRFIVFWSLGFALMKKMAAEHQTLT